MLRRTLDPSQWLTTQEAAERLGLSLNHLYRLKDCNFFQKGKHYRSVGLPTARRATFRWNIETCEKKLNDPGD